MAELGKSLSLDDATVTQIKTHKSCFVLKFLSLFKGAVINVLIVYTHVKNLSLIVLMNSYNDQINDIRAQVAIWFLISRLHYSKIF